MVLLENNLVQNFMCFEFSKERILEGERIAQKKGLQDRISFFNEDFFESEYANMSYDFIFWDNSLHHMMDTYEAIKKSYEVLKPGGIFFCNDFIGKNQFQWSDMELAIVNGIRATLDESVFQKSNGEIYAKIINRPSIEAMNASDPSEAADSESIIPAIEKIFLNPTIIPIGGLIYHLCLNGILSNIEEDSDLLKHLLDMDDETIKMGLSQYAFILARK
ncbi:MAG: class I SAM-dependent methyltransferase [Clostridium sp.]|nr:class I SAM-dependent methyltransferase [Clostridium sp.]